MKFFEKNVKIKNETVLQTRYFLCGCKMLSYSLPIHKPARQRNIILCYDSLYDENAECIDAFSFFQYLQKNNIPSKYVLLRGTRLHRELAAQNNLKDIILLNHISDFFLKCHKVIRQSRVIVSAFGLYEHYDKILAALPYLTYIYAKHGVIFLKELVLDMYPQTRFNRIVSATTKESELMIKHGTWTDELQLKTGLPRWDNLKRVSHDKKNIFFFFTWRNSIAKHPEILDVYAQKINDFMGDERLKKLAGQHNLQLNFAMHHAMLKNNAYFNIPEHIKLVPADKISDMIKKTDLFITDYSSVVFDFMFLDIPVIFYKFDTDVVYPEDSDNQNIVLAKQKDKYLYNCLYDKNAVIDRIEQYINSDFQITGQEKKINDSLFFNKKNICESLYNQIKGL